MRKNLLFFLLPLAAVAFASAAGAKELQTTATPTVANTPANDEPPFRGFAISPDGRPFVDLLHPSDAITARNTAKDECEHVAKNGICNAFSVGRNRMTGRDISVVLIHCISDAKEGGYTGSERDQPAWDNAIGKAGKDGFEEYNCGVSWPSQHRH